MLTFCFVLFRLPISSQRIVLRRFCLQIGLIAGFEDGPFESARLRRPSSVVYDTEQKCLYIADCEVPSSFYCRKHL
jgi:hypothetical protein